jgi:hypothetical protein
VLATRHASEDEVNQTSTIDRPLRTQPIPQDGALKQKYDECKGQPGVQEKRSLVRAEWAEKEYTTFMDIGGANWRVSVSQVTRPPPYVSWPNIDSWGAVSMLNKQSGELCMAEVGQSHLSRTIQSAFALVLSTGVR